MKFSFIKEEILNETGRDREHKLVFDSLFDMYNDNDDVKLEDLKDYIEELENNDRISEVADELVDVYDSDLLEWYLESPNITLDYADDAIRDLAVTSIREILSGGQYIYLEEVAREIIDMSLRILDILEEEKDNQEDTQK